MLRSRRKLLLLLPMTTLAGALALASCSSLPPLGQRQASTAQLDTDDTVLGQAALAQMARHPGLAGIHPLVDGHDAFAARALLAGAAQRTLDVQYYIWRQDTTGALLFDALRRAADRGVRVRLLLDDNNSGGLDAVLARLDAHPSVEVRLFNPSANRRLRVLGLLTDFARLNRRMHNKSFTADNQVTIVGGRNIGDEYFGAASDVSFADLDVMAIGPVVKAVSDDFDRYWNSASAYPASLLLERGQEAPAEPDKAAAAEYLDAVRRSEFIEQLVRGTLPFEWGRTRLVSDDPAKVMGKAAKDAQVMHKLTALLGKPERSLDLVSPYFVPGKDGAEAFAAMARGGAAVRILTNSLEATDVAAVHAGYAGWRKPLLEAGVSLYELRREWVQEPRDKRAGAFGSSAASLHAKTFAVDGERIFVGSFNVDQRSFHLNTEMGLVIDSPALARRLSETLDQNMPQRAYEVRLDKSGKMIWVERQHEKVLVYEEEPGTSWWKRATVRVLSWLPIEWLL
ncbi:hypothetical protein B0920_20320 [Massilia sp. KIM]|uniref:phospholipase D family protein n=1 Tax=Massilia sp. KIM TaxID=1955422 RepID=UPI0009CA37B5|nr:phospholipase D family protein [Massilia sp. KIM]OON59639.1 hypothetical protein B0920_20320 [Massilia sp. KIM]